jgi:FixJ family two-component response regulator
MTTHETVFIVDSDLDSQKQVGHVVSSMGLRHEAFATARDFLERSDPHCPGCVILEVRIPDANGLHLQQQIAQRPHSRPTIFLSTHASVPVVVKAIQQGAVNFLEKPAVEQELWDSVQLALHIDRQRRAATAELDNLHRQLSLLSGKEREVLDLIARHKTTSEMASELGVAVRTIEFRRARMLEKLNLSTPLQLAHFAVLAAHQCGCRSRYADMTFPDGGQRLTPTLVPLYTLR